MQSSHQPDISSNLGINNPILIFTCGLVTGSLIGINGIIILGLVGGAYCYRDNISALIHTAINSQKSPTPENNSWTTWGKNLIGLSSDQEHLMTKKMF